MKSKSNLLMVILVSLTASIFFIAADGCRIVGGGEATFKYLRDHRTGVCYAYVTDTSLDKWYPTSVPCTERVLKAIDEDRKRF